MSSVDKVYKRPRKFRSKRKKTKNARQDQRLKMLEKTVFTALERKELNWQDGTWNVSTGGTIINNSNSNLLYQAQGVSNEDRIGNEIMLKDIILNFNLSIPDLGDAFNQVRMIVVEPKEGNVNLVLGDVLQYADMTIWDVGQVMCSPYRSANDLNNKKYKVHYDKVFELNAYGRRCETGQVRIKYGKYGKKVEFAENESTGDGITGDPVNHNLHVMIISDSTQTLHPQFALNSRAHYFDA
ncbi:MAG: coat protein [Cressdnaviricota sp.]|nr:MAG: coat protein [Cressdnaviricota sp.]